MQKLAGYLYGHYDSRGGTVFVQAASRDEADKKYCKYVFDHLEDYTELAGDDFLWLTDLWVPDGIEFESGQDLESWSSADVNRTKKPDGTMDFERLADVPVMGKVLALTDNVLQLDSFGERPQLEFVPTGFETQMLVFAEHPRWDDDAFGFVYLR